MIETCGIELGICIALGVCESVCDMGKCTDKIPQQVLLLQKALAKQ